MHFDWPFTTVPLTHASVVQPPAETVNQPAPVPTVQVAVATHNVAVYGATPGGNPRITVNGSTLYTPVPAQIVGGRTFVPLRVISEALNANTQWLPDTRQVIVNRPDGSAFILTIDSTNVTGLNATLEVAPFIVDGTTMVPLRLFAEAFGANVTFIPAN